ncbi:adaptin ear-binding coat-associated protein 1 NECAP-1 [Pelomyxa schiedti]|nr:adaptin ear-binding coat-associated protein 1 NECAP-1 [Pelomyxa schiedti]
MSDNRLESTLLIVKECFVYRLKARTSAEGYRAEGWGPADLIWQGKLVVVERGDIPVIKLINPTNGELFAQCPVNSPTAVEPVIDSSRYFVLRLEDERNGRHAYVGMGFVDRTEAFDFNAALHDHARRQQEAKELAARRAEEASKPPVDYSLHQPITVSLNLKTAPARTSPSTTEGFGGGGLLAPPPGSAAHTRQRQAAAQPSPSPQQQLFGGFTSAPPPPSATNNNNSWGGFVSSPTPTPQPRTPSQPFGGSLL